ncbi:hypothetical protein [Nocardioides sp. AX2bis]|uniref:hypothetical protein n=1 Tax=Nocardioides sp. AX2bis TaxID=2653157 RepID=UPI0012F33E52|nr:hypothetical protein [Nocardioides sp. AX2bis]VXC09913.1 exported hypothetical protein [Nocardioides sp. AX2bis]
MKGRLPGSRLVPGLVVLLAAPTGAVAADGGLGGPQSSRPQLAVGRSTLEAGEAVRVSGEVPGRRAILQRRVDGGDWERAEPLHVDERGRFARPTTPPGGRVDLRVVAPVGGERLVSRPVALRVLEPAGRVVAEVATGASLPGDTVVVEGYLDRDDAGPVWPEDMDVPLLLQRRVGDRWATEDRGRTNAQALFELTAPAPGTRRPTETTYRVVRPVHETAQRAVSAPVMTAVVPRVVPLRVDGPGSWVETSPGADVATLELSAGEPVTIALSDLAPDSEAYLDIRGPGGEVGEDAFDERGEALVPSVSGTYTATIRVPEGEEPTSGLVWASSVQLLPAVVDGDPVVVPERRPGQVQWLTLSRQEGDLFSTECAPGPCTDYLDFAIAGEDTGHYASVGPGSQDHWNPPQDGDYYFQTEQRPGTEIWFTSIVDQPTRVAFMPETYVTTRPGEVSSLTFAAEPGARYAVNVTDLGLVDPTGRPATFDVAGYNLPVAADFLYEPHQRGRVLTTIRTGPEGGTWTIELDPRDAAVGPLEIDVVEVDR